MTRTLKPLRLPVLLTAAGIMLLWIQVAPSLNRPLGAHYFTAVEAARTMQRGIQVVSSDKISRGLMQNLEIDPNRTGLIGPELTSIVTTLGLLGSKRTATNPDLAASILGLLIDSGVNPGDAVLVTLSGSLVGANLAALIAVEALGARPIILDSVGGSMWGAVDPEYTWLDMHSSLHQAGILRTPPDIAVIGGYDGIGTSLEGVVEIRAAAARNGIQLIEAPSLAELISLVETEVAVALGNATNVKLLLNVGGGMVAMGNCLELIGLEDGLNFNPIYCRNGQAGLISTLSQQGVPILHIVNMRFLALSLGLPYDPRPLPTPGNNTRVYGSTTLPSAQD